MMAFILIFIATIGFANTPDWSAGAPVPPHGRSNPYLLDPEKFIEYQNNGKIHAQIYPVEVTGLLPPIRPLVNFIESEDESVLKRIVHSFFKKISGVRELNDLLRLVGLHEYPREEDRGVYAVPYPDGVRPHTRMGFGIIESEHGQGFTISCAACHSANLFGKTVLGLTNRFPHANETFYYAKKILPHISPKLFQKETGATDSEVILFTEAQKSLGSIGVKLPAVLGLDTSLAQVALSLARRNPDSVASHSDYFEKNPRPDLLEKFVADSKPAVWWNLKYKNKWLSDGSVLSGNPILTNILWNELGRGMDLVELEVWLKNNEQKIQELTTAVFSMEAPRITDFFPAEFISLDRAKSGEKIFLQTCAKCHGVYEKAWNAPEWKQSSLVDQLKTIEVRYPSQTPVINVGTDPSRRQGMSSLLQLNNLAISKNNGILVQTQNGYVPPPLVGIWARWPYFHNNSIPSLCALLTASTKRPKKFYMSTAERKEDYDFACNGFLKNPSEDWKQSRFEFDTQKQGLSNMGHDEGIFLKNGKELLSPEEKRDLILFLQTL